MTTLSYSLAEASDSEAIRQLLRATAMPGRISLSFESQLPHNAPEGFENAFHQTIVARDDQQHIQGVSTRSGAEFFVNGKPQSIGYIGLLRVARKFRRGLPLKLGIRYIKGLHKDGRVPYYLTSIMEDNRIARRMLTANKPGFLKYDYYTRLITHTILTRHSPRGLRSPQNMVFRSATSADIPEILECLTRSGLKNQFSPVWTEATLFNDYTTPGLRPENFILAFRGEDMLACAAVWDQRSYRKIIVMDYEPRLRRIRGLLNLISPFLKQPTLPPVGSELPHAFLSMIAVDNDDIDIFQGLLLSAVSQAQTRGIDLLMAGFFKNSNFENLISEKFRTVQNPSLIYLVSIPEDGINPLQLIDDRNPGLELALL